MSNWLAGNYLPDELDNIEDLLDIVYEKFPFSITEPIRNYKQCMKSNDISGAYRCLFDFFEISIQYNSGLIISLLIHNEVEFDEDLKAVMSKIVEKHLSLGDWVNDVFFVLINKAEKMIPENQLLANLYEGLQADSKGNLLTGWPNKKGDEYAGLIRYRNEWAHGTYRANDEVLKDISVLEPRVWKMLTIQLPLQDYEFFMVEQIISIENEDKSYTIIRDPTHQGDGFRVNTNALLEENAYYLTNETIKRRGFLTDKSIVKLSPFIINYQNTEVNVDEKFQYIFQSLKEKNLGKMVFISAHQKAGRMETELFKNNFWTLLETVFGRLIRQDKYKININREKSIDEYRERIQLETNSFLLQQTKSDKFDLNVFLDRKYLSRSYEEFLEGDCSAYMMLGDAGSGKTNQICYWASHPKTGCITLAFYSKIFARKTIEQQLREIFGESKKSVKDILNDLEIALEKANQQLCVFFDAINECNSYQNSEQGSGPIGLLTDIDSIFVENDFKRIKLVVSCRSYTWEELLNQDIIQLDRYYTDATAEEDHVTLKVFSEAEFNEVYPKYLEKFLLQTSLQQLLEDRYDFVKKRLYDPLILKTASQNFKGRELPNDLRQFNSTQLFGQRIESLERGDYGAAPLKILEEFTALLWNEFTDSIQLHKLQQAFEIDTHPLHHFSLSIFKDDSLRYKPSFIYLLEEGILRIEKGTNREVRFVYERFNEYLFARHFIQIHSTPEYRRIPIPASFYEKVLHSAGHSTVIIAALRNALIMDFYEKSKDPEAIVVLALSNLYESQPLIEEVLAVLTNESYLDVLGILEYMLNYEKDESHELLFKRDELTLLFNKEKLRPRLSTNAYNKELEIYEDLNNQLINILKVRKIAISVIYKIFKSDRIEILSKDSRTDPKGLLWVAMADPLPEVRDNASIYIYYIARYNINTGIGIIRALSQEMLSTPMSTLIKSSARKKLLHSYIEPACRVGLFIVIDGLIDRGDYILAAEVQNSWKKVVSKFTFNHTLIKLVMPFFKILLARQTVVQAEYVNNGIEYRHFWDTYPKNAPHTEWSREAYRSLIPFLNSSTSDFRQYEAVFVQGYLTGDSFTLFLLERILIVQGLKDWESISPIVKKLKHIPAFEKSKDYIEMSVIYALHQINLKSKKIIAPAEQVFNEMVQSWSIRQKGFYFAHYNDKSNAGKPYKQFVLNWYAAVYCHNYGDGLLKPGDEHSAPIIRELILLAYMKKDKALLYNCIENIAMIVPTSGYYKTALQLFEYLISLFKNESELRQFDTIKMEGKLYEKGLRSFICDMLGTVKSYYPKEVDHFIINKLKSYSFPDLDNFREEIFNHAVSHEGIGDLLTHKFGNFVIWGILNDQHINKFFIEICSFGPDCRNYIEWFDACIRHCFQEVLGVKNLS